MWGLGGGGIGGARGGGNRQKNKGRGEEKLMGGNRKLGPGRGAPSLKTMDEGLSNYVGVSESWIYTDNGIRQ